MENKINIIMLGESAELDGYSSYFIKVIENVESDNVFYVDKIIKDSNYMMDKEIKSIFFRTNNIDELNGVVALIKDKLFTTCKCYESIDNVVSYLQGIEEYNIMIKYNVDKILKTNY